MKYMLDTNTCVFALNRNAAVLRRLRTAQSDGICVSAITLAELEFGVAKSARAVFNAENLLSFLALIEVLPFGIAATKAYGAIRAALERSGRVIGSLDMLIAAHALSENLTLVTNNTREFARVHNLRIIDWSA